jgi:hypothetical protein
MGEMRSGYRKSEAKRPLGGPRQRREDNVKLDLKEIRYEDIEWIYITQDRVWWWAVVGMVMNLQVS